jgi:hypothetical protein
MLVIITEEDSMKIFITTLIEVHFANFPADMLLIK